MVEERNQIITKVAFSTIIVNIFLAIFKFGVGIFAHSTALVSDGVHSLSDILSTIIAIIGIKMAGAKADEKHEYGHERYENVSAIILAVILGVTGLGIGYSALKKIINFNQETILMPGTLALVIALLSIIVKEVMYRYTIFYAKKYHSDGLKADAWHHRSDALSSVGSFIGILGAQLGFLVLDLVASIVICLFIVKAAYDIFVDSIHGMVDEAVDKDIELAIRADIEHISGVEHIDSLQTRKFGPRFYVDVEISADENLILKDSHAIAENIHDFIEKKYPEVKHCMVHVNPYHKIK